MNPSDKEQETEKLTQIHSQLQSIYYKKKEQLEELKFEISELTIAINNLSSLISSKTFTSADDYFKEGLPEEKFKGTSIKRKIFSTNKSNEEDLQCILNLIDLSKVEVKFIEPDRKSVV